MREDMLNFTARFGKRRTKKQKLKFLEFYMDVAGKLGYTATLHKFKQGINTGLNIILGDLKAADVIFIADYDTRERVLLPGFRYSLTDEKRNLVFLRNNLLVYFAFSSLFILAAVGVLWYSLRLSGAVRWAFTGCAMILGSLSFFTADGFSSRINTKKNSALFLLFELMKEGMGKKRCFVIADLSTFTGYGRAFFYKEYPLRGKKVVLLENCATPGETFCVHSDNCSAKSLKALKEITDPPIFKEAPFSLAKEHGFEFYVLSLCDNADEPYIENYGNGEDAYFDGDAYNKIRQAALALHEHW